MQPNIQNFIKGYASSTFIARGKSIFRNSDVGAIDIDWEKCKAKFEVMSQSSDDYYLVEITDFHTSKIDAECDCPVGGLCKHGIAALLALEVKIEKRAAGQDTVKKESAMEDIMSLLKQAQKAAISDKTTEIEQKTPKIPEKTPAKEARFPLPKQLRTIVLKSFNESHFAHYLPQYASRFAPQLQKTGKISYEVLGPREVTGEMTDAVSEPMKPPIQHKVYIKKEASGNYNKNYLMACTCEETRLCCHLTALLIHIQKEWGDDGMDHVQKFDAEKNALLTPYGYTINDDLGGKFEFKVTRNVYNYRGYYNTPTVSLVVVDSSMIKIADLNKKAENRLPVAQVSPAERNFLSTKLKTAQITKTDDSFVFTYTVVPSFGGFGLSVSRVRLQYSNKIRNKFYVDVHILIRPNAPLTLENYKKLSDDDFQLLEVANNLSKEGVSNFLRQLNERAIQVDWTFQGVAYQNRLALYQFVKQNVLDLYQKFPTEHGLLLLNPSHVVNNYSEIYKYNFFITPELYHDTELNIRFRTREEGDFIIFEGEVYNEIWSRPINDGNASFAIPFTVVFDEKDWYKLNLSPAQMSWFSVFLQYGQIKVMKKFTESLVRNIIEPMERLFEIDTDLVKPIETIASINGARQLYIKEIASENIVIFHPIVQYDTIQVELNDEPTHHYLGGEEEVIIERDLIFETDYKLLLEELHPSFAEQAFYNSDGCYFWLTVEAMLEKHWFIDFFQTLRENGIELFGFNNLKKFKFNTNKAEFEMRTSSGIDWFDLHGEMSFGDQVASLRDIQKALFKKQNFVQLADGTLGLLPEDWIEKYGALLRIGNIKGNNLQVSKLHFTLLDQLYDNIDEEAILIELGEKREKLRNFTNITETATPIGIAATLRPYQKEGFNWLNFLDDFKWGGILADDMGLGKTLQIITFLQHKANLADAKNEPRQTHLIVAPTSLIFNWESEVEKFAPTLKTLIYHGGERKNLGISDFETVDMVITTYTTAAADIEKFKNFRFGYAVLDESQAIKNAVTQRYKAMRLLQADNRICMSGTPVENNTFDLYGQFNFLNPGMLGSMEYFKDQYANPIDKENDSEAAQELRRLVQPFMLRRTKELVADDLPEKTETVLYCEMGSKQRKFYDAYREKVRKQVLGEIDAKGMSNAAMIVLQGLLRLRQICDSPNLINEDDVTEFEEESIKLKELKEHIIERTGKHKMLVFSQFKGMLALIRAMLEHAKIPFLYLDGGTSPTDRKKAVDKFQTDEKYRVFLISLKAGGSGLNLTAADYVYLVDPWWNPAVEAQAIDRTHRIGQKNHVFAYKMICKDTVEEKILKLQEKKKALAADLVATETGMMKSLTRDDIAFLFS
jgi:hypothetical protein